MPTRPYHGRRLPRYLPCLTFLLVFLLGAIPTGEAAALAAGQEAPTTTGPQPTETTEFPPDSTSPSSSASPNTPPPSTTAPPTTTGAGPVEPVVTALQKVTPGVMVESTAAAGTTTGNDTSILATADEAPTNVRVANKPGGSVEIAGAGAETGVELAAAQGVTPQRPAGNVAVFAAPHPDQSDVAVQPTDTGARVMVIIRSAQEPTEYRFQVRVPRGGRLEAIPDPQSGARNTGPAPNHSGYVILDRHGEGIGSIAAPWAQAADRSLVNTWYTIDPDGSTVVQHVDHLNHQYPVVADPLLSIGCAWSTCAVLLSRSVTRQLPLAALVGSAAFGQAVGKLCAALTHPAAMFACTLMVVVADQIIFGQLQKALEAAKAANACLRVSFSLLRLVRFDHDATAACASGAEARGNVQPVRRGSQRFVSNNQAAFTEVGDALFWIPDTDQLIRLTGDLDKPWRQVRPISTNRVRRYHDLPVEGTLFQEVSNSQVYYVAAGHCWRVSAEAFTRRGFDHQEIKKVPDLGARQCPVAGDLPTR